MYAPSWMSISCPLTSVRGSTLLTVTFAVRLRDTSPNMKTIRLVIVISPGGREEEATARVHRRQAERRLQEEKVLGCAAEFGGLSSQTGFK